MVILHFTSIVIHRRLSILSVAYIIFVPVLDTAVFQSFVARR
jgi:hypothetical protein